MGQGLHALLHARAVRAVDVHADTEAQEHNLQGLNQTRMSNLISAKTRELEPACESLRMTWHASAVKDCVSS